MTEIPAELAAVLKSGDLRSLKIYCEIRRNKWDDAQNVFALEDAALDLTPWLVRVGNLTAKLDVAEVTEYTASNATLTFRNVKNEFAEGVNGGLFPDGYQVYGSRIYLYVGTENGGEKAPLFVGVIKDLPRFRPDAYQVEIVITSILEILADYEAQDVAQKIAGETLQKQTSTSEEFPIYATAQNGVANVSAVYADGVKIINGVDYQVSQLGEALSPAKISLQNRAYAAATITADYTIWKRGQTVSEIVGDLLDVAEWPAADRAVESVIWSAAIREELSLPVPLALGFNQATPQNYTFNWLNTRDGVWQNTTARDENTYYRQSILPQNFETEFSLRLDDLSGATSGFNASYAIGDAVGGNTYFRIQNGLVLGCIRADSTTGDRRALRVVVGQSVNGRIAGGWIYSTQTVANVNYLEVSVKIRKIGANWTVYFGGEQVGTMYHNGLVVAYDVMYGSRNQRWSSLGQVWRVLDDSGNIISADIPVPSIVSAPLELGAGGTWGPVTATVDGAGKYRLEAFFSDDGVNFESAGTYDLNQDIGGNAPYMRFILSAASQPTSGFNVSDLAAFDLNNNIKITFVNLSGKNVLEALQDLALISGYEFGATRGGVFFFRPRRGDTTPIYTLDETELLKVDTVAKKLDELFTKLTLDFGDVPLEFYANTGARPTAVDRYGVINKDISKPDLINYANPELAQAIGPQLLEIYSTLSNQITASAKINFALDLGDVVNFKRELPLTVNPAFSDFTKYENLNTFYRACKIIGLIYDFSKWQVKYTLQDVSSKNTEPLRDFYQYQTIFPTPLDYKE